MCCWLETHFTAFSSTVTLASNILNTVLLEKSSLIAGWLIQLFSMFVLPYQVVCTILVKISLSELL